MKHSFTLTLLFGTVVLIGLSVLSGCSKTSAPNPLANTPSKTAARVLEPASKAASQALHLSWGRYGYRDCMDGKHTKKMCDAFYKAMLPYVRENRLYAKLTLSQLTEETVWKTLRDYYNEVAFDDIGV